MLSKLMGAIAPFKLYIYIALGAIVLTGWWFDRHNQYKKGEDACQLKQMEAQASYWEKRSERLANEGKEALKQEKTTSATIAEKQNKRAAAIQKSVDMDSGGCIYTPDELLDLQQSIREANGA